jgi:hypothetical protein
MKNTINVSTLSPELQKAIKKEVSTLKTQAQKKPLSDEAIAFLASNVKGVWAKREDGKIDVKGEVYLERDPLVGKVFGKEVFFGKISGDFYCRNNNLTSLEGAPEHVGGDFHCGYNKLTSLEGAPEHVGGDFHCGNNNLTSLKGAPENVEGGFDCHNNELISLKGAPKKVGEGFYCNLNNLTSLKGSPKYVGGSFDCARNNLTSLKGAPEVVGSNFYCENNNLTSLEGAPEVVGGVFLCENNNLTSLEGIGEVKGKIISDLKSKPTGREEMTDEAAAELEEALDNLIKNTSSAYRNYENTGKRDDAKISAYIAQRLFTRFTSITGLVYFLKTAKFSLQSALDSASMSEGTSMVDDENWTDFLPDLELAAQRRLKQLR